ncbi:hypothetical protein [Vibrio sp. FJH11]
MPETLEYIYISGVNLNSVLFDTTKVSVTRGASFTLKEAIDGIATKYEDTLKPISTGASEGIFQIRLNNSQPSNTQKLIDDITDDLNQGFTVLGDALPTQFFTFVVHHTSQQSFDRAKEILLAKSRIAQQTSLRLSPKVTQQTSHQICELSGLYPTEHNQSTSPSVETRRRIGIDKRQSFYFKELSHLPEHSRFKHTLKDKLSDINKSISFTDDLETLASIANTPLKGKIALFYSDGNKFGQIQKELIDSAQDKIQAQVHFDKQVKTYRTEFLAALIEKVEEHVRTFNSDTNVTLPLEVLMWGGDEFYIVVPAELGFEVLNLFYEQSANWCITSHEKSISLTHASGLVFCNAKTPLLAIQRLAHELAEEAKNWLSGSQARSNLFYATVLESIDYPTEDIRTFWKAHYNKELGTARSPLKPKGSEWLESIRLIKSALPRAQLYQIVHAALRTSSSHNHFDTQLERFMKVHEVSNANALIDYVKSAFEVVRNNEDDIAKDIATHKERSDDVASDSSETFTDQALPWLNLIEFWDYLPEGNHENQTKS